MCDYSLHAFANRLADDGEELVLHRFFGGSMGLASPDEVAPLSPPILPSNRGFWFLRTLRRWFVVEIAGERQPCAVCIPPGATVILRDIPASLQREFGVDATEEVTFLQTTANANTYRDALRFSNQRQILLQSLRPGQRVSVVSTDIRVDAASSSKLTAGIAVKQRT